MNQRVKDYSAGLNLASLIVLVSWIFLSSVIVAADPGVRADIRVREFVAAEPPVAEWVDSNSIDLPIGTEVFGLQGNFTIRLLVKSLDTQFAELQYHLATIGPSVRQLSGVVSAELGTPFVIDSIPGKGKSYYRALVTLETADVSRDCLDELGNPSEWPYDPSAQFDIYYLKNSLADAHWNVIRDFLEREYEDLRKVFDFDYPGKSYVFLCPCQPEDMDFEPGFGIAVDPGRLAGYAAYSRARNAVDPLLTNLMKFYRWWGHSPRLLVWGVAGYTDFSDYYAKQYLREGRLPSLNALVHSIDFRRTEPSLAYFTAASFIHYFIQTAGVPSFKDLYERSTDLSLKPAFLAVTGKTLAQWETEWRRYLRQREFRYPEYIFHAHRAQAILREDEHINFLQLAVDDLKDSTTIPLLLELAGSYYSRGDYGTAYTWYKKVVETEPDRAAYHQYFGNICSVLGRLDEASSHFENAIRLDSTFSASHLSMGEVMASRGMIDSALTLWRIGMDAGESIPVGIELTLKLEQYLRQNRQPPDDPQMIIIARNLVANLLGQYPDNPRYLMRMGNVLTEMNKVDSALAYFDAAEFFETRPYFQAVISLSRGKALDRAGRRREAVEAYEKVFDYPCGYLTRREAEKYINRIYR